MPAWTEIVELDNPRVFPEISLQAAELVLEIGNYKATRDVDMILGAMVGRTTIAALDGHEQVIGTAGLRIVRRGFGVVEDVVSDPTKRGEGIGRKIIEGIESLALSKGVIELNLASSMQAVPFYRHLGYRQWGSATFKKYL